MHPNAPVARARRPRLGEKNIQQPFCLALHTSSAARHRHHRPASFVPSTARTHHRRADVDATIHSPTQVRVDDNCYPRFDACFPPSPARQVTTASSDNSTTRFAVAGAVSLGRALPQDNISLKSLQ